MSLQASDIQGTYTALATPFDRSDESLDEPSLHQLIDFQLAAKVQGIVVCGSTGESLSLSKAEYERVIRLTCQRVKGHVPVVAGISLSSMMEAIVHAQSARDAGADALLVAPLPYIKPSQLGIGHYFNFLLKACGLPIIAYNNPSRCGVAISAETTIRLAVDRVIIGLKDSSSLVDTALDVLAGVREDFAVMSGEDSLVWPIMSCGGKGTISASANVVPEMFVKLTDAGRNGQVETARRAQLELLPIIRALFLESNPVPVKAALHLKGIIKSPAVRLPLLEASRSTLARLREVLHL